MYIIQQSIFIKPVLKTHRFAFMKVQSSTDKLQSNQQSEEEAEAFQCKKTMEQKTYKIGLAVFRSAIKKRQILCNFNGKVIEILQKDIWMLKGPDANKTSKWPQIFAFMIETFIQELHFQKNPKILKEIELIAFHNMKELNVFAAGIESYEAFAYLKVPILEKINLIYNKCVNFKALNKVWMPSVKIICIYMQQSAGLTRHGDLRAIQALSTEDFGRWGFDLNELRLEKGKYDIVMTQDLGRLAKCKPSLEHVYYSKVHRIQQQRIREAIKRKGQVKFQVVYRGVVDFVEEV